MNEAPKPPLNAVGVVTNKAGLLPFRLARVTVLQLWKDFGAAVVVEQTMLGNVQHVLPFSRLSTRPSELLGKLRAAIRAERSALLSSAPDEKSAASPDSGSGAVANAVNSGAGQSGLAQKVAGAGAEETSLAWRNRADLA